MYKAPETYTQSFFFCCGLDKLKVMDESKGNTNSVVLSNINFRKAFSLAIDRDEYVGATEGFLPAYSMLNTLYYYDAYNDPTSSYRNSVPAKQAIVNFYEVAYGEGTPYADLDAAYASINGYNLTEAKELMKVACEELVAAGLYTEGQPIHIRLGWMKGAIDSPANQQVALMNKYINAAAEGSGFGTITLEAIGNLANRYADVAAGEFAIGYGAWGGAAFYPFRNFQVYCDPDQYDIHEAGCWDPTTETLTINVEGEDVTKTWQEWSGCMVGSGDMANKSFETKLQILATMEEEYMRFVYRIPFASSTVPMMCSYQIQQYTNEYNIMYGFGGTELLTYNYTDAEWAEFVAEQGGTLNYE
jgi:oligopeptide transport system substrate-binding protein